jgi:hypothetical protein
MAGSPSVQVKNADPHCGEVSPVSPVGDAGEVLSVLRGTIRRSCRDLLARNLRATVLTGSA